MAGALSSDGGDNGGHDGERDIAGLEPAHSGSASDLPAD
jgi:hypothetical protein